MFELLQGFGQVIPFCILLRVSCFGYENTLCLPVTMSTGLAAGTCLDLENNLDGHATYKPAKQSQPQLSL